MSQPRRLDSNISLQEYFQWQSQAWVEVVADSDSTSDEKVNFMPLQTVKEYFTADNSKRLSAILADVFQSDFPPVDAGLVLREHTAIFCILLSIDQARYIEYFAQYEELSDRRLPFDSNRPPEDFPVVDDAPTFFERFCEKQRIYCVPVFDGHMLHKRFGAQRLLPITHKEPYGTEGKATRYIISIYGPHNKMLPLEQDRNETTTSNMFLLKSYVTKEGNEAYTQEVNGFRSMKHTESIMRFFGSYVRGPDSNVLLEFADKGSLEEFFDRETPPSRGPDIIKFWENLFQLIKGLKAVHSTRDGHFNVSTETILVLSNGSKSSSDWQFKFANFGIDRAKKQDNDRSQTYAPPECSPAFDPDDPTRRSSLRVTSAADIWSLGCIYSEAAMWIVDGYKGLLDYRSQRRAETERILSHGGDCFHNGEQMLHSVLDAHNDIEDRLRRSDCITKDVLESMVDEMLWEEDRPNAKALLRKSEMVLTRARQKSMPVAMEEPPVRTSSRQNRHFALPRVPPPSLPLPPVPRSVSSGYSGQGLASINERQQAPLPNVERWRLQLPVSSREPGVTAPPSTFSSPTLSTKQLSSANSIADLDREINGSVASWQGDDASSVTTPYTPITSPHTSINFDRHHPNEGRQRLMRNQSSYEYKRPPGAPSTGFAYIQDPPAASTTPPPPTVPPRSPERFSAYVTAGLGLNNPTDPAPLVDPRTIKSTVPEQKQPPPPVDETRSIGRASSGVGRSRPSSEYSFQGAMQLAKSNSASRTRPMSAQSNESAEKKSKRGLGFSLFPGKSKRGESTPKGYVPSVAGSDSTGTKTPTFNVNDFGKDYEYLSLNTCLEWKRAHKKSKKHSQVPDLPGAYMLDDLKGRDHCFIIDDSASMIPVWSDVKKVFECLSYVVKGMSPLGTELYFTISYDTWRRKDTHDLLLYLENRESRMSGESNIGYRLNLQMESHRLKLQEAKAKGKLNTVRPVSYYILTNGEWGKGANPKVPIKTMADYLLGLDLTEGHCTVEFVNFAQEPKAGKRIKELCATDFGVSICDTTRWTGNVLKMLRGPMDKSLFDSDGGEVGSQPQGLGKTAMSSVVELA